MDTTWLQSELLSLSTPVSKTVLLERSSEVEPSAGDTPALGSPLMDGTDTASHKRASQDLSVITRLPSVTRRSSSTLPLRMGHSKHHLGTVTASSGI